MQASGRGVGWEQMGEPTGDFTGDFRGDSTAGDLAGDLVGDEAGTLTGEPTDVVEEGSQTGVGEGYRGLLAAGDGVVFSGTSGSGKKRMPGDVTRAGGDVRVIWQKKQHRRSGFN